MGTGEVVSVISVFRKAVACPGRCLVVSRQVPRCYGGSPWTLVPVGDILCGKRHSKYILVYKWRSEVIQKVESDLEYVSQLQHRRGADVVEI